MQENIRRLSDAIRTELQSDTAALAALDAAEAIEPVPESDEIRFHLPERGMTIGLHRLLARALEHEGQTDESRQILLQVAERLNQAEFWTALVRVVEPLLEALPQQIAPLLARIRARSVDHVSPELLDHAHSLLPQHGLLAWEVAQSRQGLGDEDGAQEAARAALPELVKDKNFELADEAVLLLAESGRGANVGVLMRSLELLARQETWPRFDTVLELTIDLLSDPDHAPGVWPRVADLWLPHPDSEAMRPLVVRVAEGAFSGYPDPRALLRSSRINIPSEDPETCLERLRKAIAFPPGHFAQHSSWGIGKIRENDTEVLVIDFPTKPLHRMTLATAERALDSLEPGDLRVLRERDPDGLKRLVKEEAATVIVLAIKQHGKDESTVEQLRKILVPGVIPSTGWAGWWKSAKKLVAADGRIDSRRAYDNIYRLPVEGESVEDVAIPEWNPSLGVIKNVAVLDTYADHHPDSRSRLGEAFAEKLRGILAGTKRALADRVAAGLWLDRMGLEAVPSPASIIESSFDFNGLPKTQQEQLLERIDFEAGWLAAMNSRLAGIRRSAWESLDEGGQREDAAVRLLGSVSESPEAALHILEEGLPDVPGADRLGGKFLLGALVDVLETPPRETHRKRGMALLTENSDLAKRLREAPLSEDDATKLIARLKAWRASDKYRFPLLDFLRIAGHAFLSEIVEGHRARSAARLALRTESSSEDPFDGDLVMTRASLDRLQAERHRLGMELKTNIPKTIDSARQLGDLKENAEYHAAKAKQAEYAQRFQDLENMLKRIRLIEDLDRAPDTAFPGTEVVLRSTGEDAEEETLWLLGEGDQALGQRVVSYKAPIGRALLGRKPGDTVELPQGDHPYTIVRVTEKLP